MENNYQLSRIHNYIHGLMSREEMHALEREALEDPFLQDAIDGYRLQNGVDSKSLSLLQQRLTRRVAEQAHLKNKHFFGWQRLAIGMVAAVMFLSVCLLLLLRHLPQRKQVNITEVELMDEHLQGITVQTMSGSNAEPIGGWNAFEAFLAAHYPGTNVDKELLVRFQIDAEGKPYAIEPAIDTADVLHIQIKEILEQGPRWTGTNAVIKIVFPE